MILLLFVVNAAFGGTRAADVTAVRNLVGEPDYRQVRLHWEVESGSPETTGNKDFHIKYCELQTWGTQRCRTQPVPMPDANEIESKMSAYNVEVKGLRMATTYSFEIKRSKKADNKEIRENRAQDNSMANNPNVIVVPTKGFSAKATLCLPHASEIEVSTGPHFGGRIAVEAADGERCGIDGDATSPRDIYTLRINHTECGSQVNETTVSTFVLVQENLPILTHSTRRFQVLCSYQPETLTVRAGLNLPTGYVAALPPETMDGASGGSHRRGRNFRYAGLVQKPEALVKEEESSSDPTKNNVVPIIVIAMLCLAGAIGVIAIVLKLSTNQFNEEFDNVSMSSGLSSSSGRSSCTRDLEAICANPTHPTSSVMKRMELVI